MTESWWDEANCRGRDTELFYPERGRDDTDAKLCCYDCPVREACLTYALHRDEAGIWGGKSEEQRKALRRQLGITPKREPSISHGTNAGARAHYRAGEKPCRDCADAQRIAERERRGTSEGLQRDPRTGRWSA